MISGDMPSGTRQLSGNALELLQNALMDLPTNGVCIKRRAYRQIWRVDLPASGDGSPGGSFYLKLYPRAGQRLKRYATGNPAMAEFSKLQRLQKAGIPAVRVSAVLNGLMHEGEKWDAVVLPALPPGRTLDGIFHEHLLAGTRHPQHRMIAGQIVDICRQLVRAGLGHRDLHLGNFYQSDDKLYLLDGYAVRTSPLNLRDLQKLGFSVGAHATRSDLLRGWKELAGGPLPPANNRISRRQLRNYLERAWPGLRRHNAYFYRPPDHAPAAESTSSKWRFITYRKSHFARRWAPLSREAFEVQAGSSILLTDVLDQMAAGQGEWLKRGGSGDVWHGTPTIFGRPLEVVAKLPRRKYWYRHLTDFLQGDRSARAWTRSWQMAIRDLPVAWPLMRAVQQTGPYVRQAMLITAWVAGENLAGIRLHTLSTADRTTLFFRLGRTIRRIEQAGFCHFDTKTSNWIIQADPVLGPVPVMVDVDGIRPYRWNGEGMRRLRLSLAEHPEFGPADLANLELGYNPWAKSGGVR